MVATDFTDQFAPLPPGHVERTAALRDKIVLGQEWLRTVLWDNGARMIGLPER